MFNGSNSNSGGEGPTHQVYEGGLVDGNPKTFPASSSNGESNMDAPGGEGGIKTANGGPAVNGGNTTTDFLDSKGYDTGSMEAGRPGAMKIVNPDSLSNSLKS